MASNPFYVAPMGGTDFSQGLQGLGAGLERRRERKEKAQATEQQQAMTAEMMEAIKSRDPMKVAMVSAKYPQFSDQILSAGKFATPDTKQDKKDTWARIYSDPANTAQYLTEHKERLDALGVDSTHTDRDIQAYNANPTGFLEQYEPVAAAILGKDFIKMRAGEDGGGIGTISPKDFTVESMAAYESSGNIKDLVRFRPKTVDINGIEHIYDSEESKFVPVVDYGEQELSEQVAASAELDAERASRVEFGKQKDVWDNNQPKYLNNISAAEQKQTVVRNTADRIQDLVSGWSTKYGSSLSSVPGSEARTLKGLIDTMKANSAFSTLTDLKAAGGTLGAISEAELNLLERAWGALDQGGDNAEFLRVLDQLVTQNSGGIDRLRNAFSMNKKRFAGSYDDAQRQRQEENTVSWDSI